MKKNLLAYFGIVLGLFIASFFVLNIFEMSYFNESYYIVPDLRSYTSEQASKILSKSHLHLREVGKGNSSYPYGEIFLQEPEPGKIVKKNRNIKVWISEGVEQIYVPNLLGLNLLDAKVIAENNGLRVKTIASIKDKGKYNEVLATYPTTDNLIPKGSEISFLVNNIENVTLIKMPDVIGLSLEEAKTKLASSGLNIGQIDTTSISGIASNVVVKTNYNSGDKVPLGTPVILTVNN